MWLANQSACCVATFARVRAHRSEPSPKTYASLGRHRCCTSWLPRFRPDSGCVSGWARSSFRLRRRGSHLSRHPRSHSQPDPKPVRTIKGRVAVSSRSLPPTALMSERDTMPYLPPPPSAEELFEAVMKYVAGPMARLQMSLEPPCGADASQASQPQLDLGLASEAELSLLASQSYEAASE